MDSLRTRNFWLMCLHSFTGLSGTILSFTAGNLKDFRIPLSTIEITSWDSVNYAYATLGLSLAHNFEFVFYASLNAWMSAFGHFAVLQWWDTYESGLKRGINRFRWWEYAASSTLMIVQICMLFGVYDVTSLFFIGMCNTACIFFGDVMELTNAGRKPEDVDWTPFQKGLSVGFWSWFVIAVYLAASPGSEGAPWFVWVILVEYFVFFNSFPYTLWQQYSGKGRYNNSLYPELDNGGYLAGERTYGTLSLVSKTLLVWIVIFGAQ